MGGHRDGFVALDQIFLAMLVAAVAKPRRPLFRARQRAAWLASGAASSATCREPISVRPMESNRGYSWLWCGSTRNCSTWNVHLKFAQAALRAIAREALKRTSGARGLRAIM